MMLSKRVTLLPLLPLLLLPLCLPTQAAVTELRVETRTALPANGGTPYEVLRGSFRGEIDPADPRNALITDVMLAPRNARGRVEYEATFSLAKPVDLKQASGVLIYDVPNRGNGQVGADPQGHIRVISGWQGDIAAAPNRQTLRVPVARHPDGTPVTGPALARFVDMLPNTSTLPIVAGLGGQTLRPAPVSLASEDGRLLRRQRGTANDVLVPPDDWAFADCTAAPFPGVPDPTKLCLRGGFDTESAYTLVYTARDPLVLGLGFAATRDLNAFLRHARHDALDHPNPVAGAVRWTVAMGTSQSGNFLRSYLHLGFNADEQGRTVFDGVLPNIAGRHVPLNVRFGVPGGASDEFEIGSEGPLWWSDYDDQVRGRGVNGLLRRCTASGTCPKIVETFGSAEFWGLRMSPNLVGTAATADIALPANVRRYYFPSVTHGGAHQGGFNIQPDPAPPGRLSCRLQSNPNPSNESVRALQQALVRWVTTDTPPPPSRYPTLAAGDLVAPTAQALRWPAIPSAPSPDGKINTFIDYDFGPALNAADVSGIATVLPPRTRAVLPSLVPRVDQDGNETSGVASVQLQVPLGTYTGWNERVDGYFRGAGCGFSGGFIPFAVTRAQRLASGDPRASLEERYGSHQGFVKKVQQAVDRQVAAGWLLPQDAARLMEDARASDVLQGVGERGEARLK